ncbi:MAG TPA: nucleotidyltransferase domain-containing protein [Ktedonobacteraceae bacterium]
MSILQPLPGTPEHQKFLQAIVSYYTDDPRILAIIVFGSIGRGNWDPYSDLDLDIIIGDDVRMNILQELERMIYFLSDIKGKGALIIPHSADAADVVFPSLMELSVRYHTLVSTSPNIVESMKVLWGHIDEAAIIAAGLANRKTEDTSPGQLLDMCVRYALETNIALQRRRLWEAIELEHRIRALLMELFALSHDRPRPTQGFQEEADAPLQALLGTTLPQFDLLSIQKALLNLLDILEHKLGQFIGRQVQLTQMHLNIIKQVRDMTYPCH